MPRPPRGSMLVLAALPLLSCGAGSASREPATIVIPRSEAGGPLPSAPPPPAITMASLPGGTFNMGASGATVTVRAFEIDRTEVTAAAYASCVRDGRCSDEGLGCADASTYGARRKSDHPINCVSWDQATAYCAWAEKRLPTEEEWEWAARGQSRGSTYPWGDAEPRAQVCWDGEGNELGQGKRNATCAVGSHPRGDAPGGIHDLAGNVWEWTSSGYGAEERVFRGGSWGSNSTDPAGEGDRAPDLRASHRVGIAPDTHHGTIGFRCVR